MSDQTFEQSLLALRDWLTYLEDEERRLTAQLERLKKATAKEADEEGTDSLPSAPSFEEPEEDDWL